MQCCTGNGTQGLYYAWEAIARRDVQEDGLVQVNLLLNRASPWADVESFLPFEGRVVVRAKTARRVAVRMPRWVEPGDVKVRGASGSARWIGRYLVADFGPGRAVELELPVPEETASFSVDGTTYTCRFRGNDCVGIEPRTGDPGCYPMYVDKPAAGRRTLVVQRYVSSTILPW
jgi:hypothetical protein